MVTAGLSTDFSHRLVHLFSYAFRDFDPYLALSVVDNGRKQLMLEGADGVVVDSTNVIDATQLSFLLTLHDLKRLEAYSRNLVRAKRLSLLALWLRFSVKTLSRLICHIIFAGGLPSHR